MASGLASLVGRYASDSENSDGPDDGSEDASRGVEQVKGDDDQVEDEEKSSGGDDGSGEDSSAEDEEDDDSDDDGDDASQRRKTSATLTASNSLLPSVDDLFNSTVGPDFLAAPGAGEDFVLEAMKKTTTPTPLSSTAADGSDVTRAGSKRGREAGAQGAGGAGALSGGGLPPGVVKKPKGGAVGPTGPPSEKGKKKGVAGEKISAKDKVKGQRLKGQSGIGSDFRTWKSDLEMTMRQQYD